MATILHTSKFGLIPEIMPLRRGKCFNINKMDVCKKAGAILIKRFAPAKNHEDCKRT